MADRITPNIFFRELFSYAGYGGELAQSSPYIQGIGEAALLDIPDMFDKFGSIKGVMFLEWESNYDRKVMEYTKGVTQAIPFIRTPEGVSRLYLPITQVQAPFTGVTSDLYPFRKSSSGDPVNLIVYKDEGPTLVTLAMILRNSKLSPWVKFFTYLIGHIRDRGRNIKLCIPRMDYGMGAGEFNETYRVPVRIVKFDIANVIENGVMSTLSVLPELQGLELIKELGL